MKEKTLFALISAIPAIMHALMHDFDPSELTLATNRTQNKVLMIIEMLPGATMTQISKMAGLEKGSFTAVADKLIESGFVKRGKDPKDRRKIILQLTPEGKTVSQQIKHCIEAHLENKISSLSDSQQKELKNAVAVLSRYANKIKK